MQSLELTQAEINKLEYNDLAIKSMLTEKQKEEIEKKDYVKIILRRNKLIKGLKILSSKEEKKIYLNSLPRKQGELIGSVKLNELSDSMIEKETQYFLK